MNERIFNYIKSLKIKKQFLKIILILIIGKKKQFTDIKSLKMEAKL